MVTSNLQSAIALHQGGAIEAAATQYRALLAHDPNDAEALALLALTHHQTRDYDAAIALFEDAINKAPAHAARGDWYNNCAEAYRATYAWEKAFDYYGQAIAAHGAETAPVLFNLAGAMQEIGEHQHAINLFSRCIELAPTHASAHLRLGYAHLSLGELEAGWREFEWHVSALTGESYLRHPAAPHNLLPRPSSWRDHVEGCARLLVIDDQGLGDDLCMLRCAPRLTAAGWDITYTAANKLTPILTRCHPQLIEPHPSDQTNAPCRYTGASELPMLARINSPADIPAPLPLQADQQRKAAISRRLDNLPRPWIALTWRAGNPNTLNGQSKCIALEDLLQTLQPITGTLLLVQRGIDQDELAQVRRSGLKHIDLSAQSDDLEMALAIMALADEYVSVSNTNVHLRTSIGKRSRVLSVVSPIDFRWPSSAQQSPWFPNCPIYRQALDGSWQDALSALARDLRSH